MLCSPPTNATPHFTSVGGIWHEIGGSFGGWLQSLQELSQALCSGHGDSAFLRHCQAQSEKRLTHWVYLYSPIDKCCLFQQKRSLVKKKIGISYWQKLILVNGHLFPKFTALWSISEQNYQHLHLLRPLSAPPFLQREEKDNAELCRLALRPERFPRLLSTKLFLACELSQRTTGNNPLASPAGLASQICPLPPAPTLWDLVPASTLATVFPTSIPAHAHPTHPNNLISPTGGRHHSFF